MNINNPVNYWYALRLQLDSKLKWHLRHLLVAKQVSTWSKDPSTQCGAVIVDKLNRPVSWGTNGFPRKVKDDKRLFNREVKYSMVLHAEENAVLFAKRDLTGHSIYVWPSQPCAHCSSVISQVGIDFVGFAKTKNSINDRWKDNYRIARKTLKESKILSLIHI